MEVITCVQYIFFPPLVPLSSGNLIFCIHFFFIYSVWFGARQSRLRYFLHSVFHRSLNQTGAVLWFNFFSYFSVRRVLSFCNRLPYSPFLSATAVVTAHGTYDIPDSAQRHVVLDSERVGRWITIVLLIHLSIDEGFCKRYTRRSN